MQKWSFTFGSMVITDKPLKLSMEKVTLYVKYYLYFNSYRYGNDITF